MAASTASRNASSAAHLVPPEPTDTLSPTAVVSKNGYYTSHIPVHELIEGKKLLFVDDSIVYFSATLRQPESEILSRIEVNFKAKLQYAAQYAFHAGLYSGFGQHFSNQDLVEVALSPKR